MHFGAVRPRGGQNWRVILVICLAGAAVARVDGVATYGCKFSRGLCRPDEVCVDDNLFGSCQDAAVAGSRSRLNYPVFVLDSRLRGLLEVVMHDLVRGGYSWRDTRTQCVISAVLTAYEGRQSDVRTSACDAYTRSTGIGGGGGKSDSAEAAASTRDRLGGELTSIVDLLNAAGARDGYGDDDYYDGNARDDSERLRLRPAADDGSRTAAALSRGDLQALELFLQLSDATGGSSAVDSLTSAVAAVAAARLPAEPGDPLLHASADTRPGHGYGESNRPKAAPLRKIDEELVGRLLRDEIGVDELMPEEIRQLTLFVKTMLSEMAVPVAGAATPSPAPPVVVKPAAVSSGQTRASNSIRDHDAVSAFVEEAMMVNHRGFADGPSHLLPSTEPSVSQSEAAAAAASAKPAASSDAELEAELEQVRSDDQPVLDGTAKQVHASAASAIIANNMHVDVVDSSYGWVRFVSSVDPQEAKMLLSRVAQKLGIANSSIVDLRVKDDEVAFHVLPNDHNINATEVAKAIAEYRDELVSAGSGGSLPDVHSVGIGTGESLLDIDDAAPAAVASMAGAAPRSRRLLLAMSLVGGTCLIAVAIAGTVVCVVRKKRARTLQGKLVRDDRRGVDSTGSGDSLLARDEYEDLVRRERCRKKAGDDWRSASTGGGDADGGGRGEEYGSQNSGSVSSWSEEPAIANMDVSTGHMVLSYMEDHLKNKERLDKEWQDLCAYEADPNATDVASLHKNRKKNRYLTVFPYDHNRVVLDEKNNVASEDYINASFIVDHDPRSPAYIATQGPLVHTVADFWQMVWEQGCVVIAMLTRLSEGSVAMCHRYWPHDSSELYHIYEVHLVSEHVWSDDYLVRSFYLKNLETNETRTVTQFHYLAWPEGGVPAASKSLLDFRRKVNKSYRGRSRPVMVVCSDGAGRTGSFILLDMVINRMNKGAKEIDIAATLEFLRDQRMGTVKTREQFEFVLTSVAEEVQAVLRAGPH